MTKNPDRPFDGAIRTEDEFNSTLGELLLAAQRNGVNPRGTWVVGNQGGFPGWETEIYELANGNES